VDGPAWMALRGWPCVDGPAWMARGVLGGFHLATRYAPDLRAMLD
jgi:hypothetical protein